MHDSHTLNPVPNDAANNLMVQRATYASVSVAITLIFFKSVAWWMTDSISLLSTLLDSFLDAGASLLTLFAVRHAMRPPSDNYRFGHGKLEALAALGQGLFIIISSLLLLRAAIDSFQNPTPPEHTAVGVGVMIFSIALTYGLVRFQRRVVRQTNSLAVGADSLHYFSDILINGGVIVSLVGSWYLGWVWLDPLFGLCIVAYIFYTAIEIMAQPLGVLMDRELPTAHRQRIMTIVRDHPDIVGYHDLRTRSSGKNVFIQMHLELDKNLPLFQAHAITEALEEKLYNAFPGAEVLIHQDPV